MGWVWNLIWEGEVPPKSGLKLRSLESYLELIWRIGDDGYIPEPTCIFFD
jgi:hypothetical protein